MEPDFDLLGDQLLQEIGADPAPSSFDPSFLVNMAAELTNRGVSAYQSSEAQKNTAAEVASKAASAIALDNAATQADYIAMLSAAQAASAQSTALVDSSKSDAAAAAVASAEMDRMAADQAIAEAVAAGAGMPAESTTKRLKAAQDAVTTATKAAQAANSAATKASTDLTKRSAAQAAAFKVKAAQATVSRIASGAVKPGSNVAMVSATSHSGSSFLTKVHAGIPTWGWMAGGTLTLTGLGLLIRSLLKRKR